MYKILLLTSFMAILSATNAQLIDSTRTRGLYIEETSEYYLQKSKTQKIVGAVISLGGALLVVNGMGQVLNNLFSESNEGESMFIIGSGLMLGSIPLFIASGTNRRRAMLAAGNRPLSFGKVQRRVSSLTLSLPIGR